MDIFDFVNPDIKLPLILSISTSRQLTRQRMSLLSFLRLKEKHMSGHLCNKHEHDLIVRDISSQMSKECMVLGKIVADMVTW